MINSCLETKIYIREFYKFLNELGIFGLYVKRFTSGSFYYMCYINSKPKIFQSFFETTRPDTYISSAFVWPMASKEENWCEINNKWRTKVGEIKKKN